jgi:hypothetical protein
VNAFCTGCGAALIEGTRFCVHCGAAVQPLPTGAAHAPQAPPAQLAPHAPVAPIAPGVPPPPGTAQAVVAETAVCRSCGVIAPVHRQTCVQCDSSLHDRQMVSVSSSGFWAGVMCRFRCRACGHDSPLNHLDLDGSVECLRCGIDQRFDRKQWESGLSHAHAVSDLCGPNPLGRFSSGAPLLNNPFDSIGVEHTFAELEQGGHQSVAVKAMPGHPLCPKCKAPLAVHAASAELFELACPRCPHRTRYDLPPGAIGLVRGLAGVVAEEQEQGGRDAGIQEDASGAVAIRCPNCSGPLPADGRRTVMHCTYCGIAVRFPASALRRLGHHDARVELWWIYFTQPSGQRAELEAAALADQQRRQERQRQAAARAAAASAPRPAPRKRSGWIFKNVLPVAATVGVLGAGGGVTYLLEQRAETSPELPAAAAAAATATPGAARAPAPKFILEWTGKVTSAQGKALKKGSACDVRLETAGPAIQWLNVSCGKERLYDSRSPLNGMSMHSSVLAEAPHAERPTHWGYAISYQDTGQRTGRSQIQLDTTRREAVIYSESMPAFRVRLSLPTTSQPRVGEPIYDTPRNPSELALDLSVKSTSGSVGVKPGATCKLRMVFVNSLPSAKLCKTTLVCGKEWLYGTKQQPGFTACTLDAQASPASGYDRQPVSGDGSPELEVDVPSRRVSLKSSEDAYRVELVSSP